MISSEVQRTLVKSPPELWAELSDPDSLARHLGELGEVRIVRVDPEKSVEWEAENTTGKVAISASGWGTRVTLSVTREQAAAEDPVIEGAEPDGDAPALAAEPEASVPLGAEDDAQGPVAEDAYGDEDEPDLDNDEGEGEDADYDPDDLATVAYEDQDGGAPEDAIVAVSPALAATPAGERAVARAASEPDEPHAFETDEAHAAAPVRMRRRGFFARLFGRRSRAATDVYEPTGRPLSEHGRDELQGDEDAAVAEPEGNAIDAGANLAEAPEPAIEDAPSFADTRQLAAADVPEDAAENATEHIEDAAQEDRLSAGPAEISAEEPESAEGDADADARAPDLAAELRAAEEAAEQEITAVLTGVLDRLGAAHHRPFSRA